MHPWSSALAALTSLSLAGPAAAQVPFVAELACDVVPGAVGSNPQHFTKAGDSVYFAADNGLGGREVFKITGPGTCERIDLGLGDAGYDPFELTAVNGDLYFLTVTAAEGAEVGGVVGGVPTFISIGAGSANGLNDLELVAFQGSLYFQGNDGGGAGSELWRITEGVASLVVDIRAGPGSGGPSNFRATSERLYFQAFTPTTGSDLFAYTGSVLISFDVVPGSDNASIDFAVVAGQDLIFLVTLSFEMQNIFVLRAGDSAPTFIASFVTTATPLALAATIVFAADDGVNGMELHTTDGVTTTQHELTPGPGSSEVEELALVGDKVWLSGKNAVDGNELHIFDLATGLFESFDLNPGPAGSFPYAITPHDDFTAAMGAFVAGSGDELVTATAGDGPDGSVFDFRIGPMGSLPDMITAPAGPGPIFARANTDSGQELVFQTLNGGKLSAGIVQLDGSPASPTNLTVVDGDLYFSGVTIDEGREPRFVNVTLPEPQREALACAALVALGMLRTPFLRRTTSRASRSSRCALPA